MEIKLQSLFKPFDIIHNAYLTLCMYETLRWGGVYGSSFQLGHFYLGSENSVLIKLMHILYIQIFKKWNLLE